MREYINNEKVTEFKEPDPLASYTYADYLQWDAWNEWVELIRGRIFKMGAAPSRIHQTIAGNLLAAIHIYLRGNPCQVFVAPFDVRLPLEGKEDSQVKNVVQPDICVVCDSSKLDARGCIGAPDWIVEILSPSNLEKDLQLKYTLYEESGVREYWVIYPQEKTIHAYVLADGKYTVKQAPAAVTGNISPYILPELTMKLEDVFENT